jgi:type II secretory pathway pseudopilin PulG
VAIALVTILIYLAVPRISFRPPGCKMVQVLSNAKQLYLATQQMALDGQMTGETNLGWPGDIGGTFTNWAHQLVAGSYLTTNDFLKLMSAPGVVPPPGRMPEMKECALLVYAVSTNSPGNTVFLTSANFTNSPSGGMPPAKKAKPYGDKGFVVFRVGGDGAVLQPRQTGAAYTNIIGGYAPLCR